MLTPPPFIIKCQMSSNNTNSIKRAASGNVVTMELEMSVPIKAPTVLLMDGALNVSSTLELSSTKSVTTPVGVMPELCVMMSTASCVLRKM